MPYHPLILAFSLIIETLALPSAPASMFPKSPITFDSAAFASAAAYASESKITTGSSGAKIGPT
jgi:hypothetical protein